MRALSTLRRAGVKAVAGLAVAASVAVGAATPATADHRPPDHLLFWNNALFDAFRQVGGTPGPLSRGGAMMNLAVYDAVNSIRTIGKPYRTTVASARGRYGALETAVDYAAYTALKAAFPTVDFDDDLAAALALPRGGTYSDRTFGQTLGQTTATAIINDRADDGSSVTTPYTPVLEPGHWRPSAGATAGGANWGKVKPFALASPSQFRPAPLPYGFTSLSAFLASPQYAAGVDEVRRLGSATSTERTAEQTLIARYWANDVDGSYKPVGHQYDHALAIWKKYRPTATSYESAKFFGLTSIALADGAIAVWNSKYESPTDLWRPHHSIHLADTDGNPATSVDMNWAPLSMNAAGTHFTPQFPSYVSGHTGIAAAWGRAVQLYFGTDYLSWTGGTDDPNAVGVTRSFTSVSQSTAEKAASRLYAGVHFRWDNETALLLGKNVGDYVVANSL